MNRAYVDTNVILRLVTGEPPEMADVAAELFARADNGELELVVDPMVIAEAVWVLSSFFGFGHKDIAPILQTFLLSNGILSSDKLDLLRALTLYEEKNIDFTDAFLAARMMKDRIAEIYSFDAHFDQLGSVRRLLPRRESGPEDK